MSTRIINAACMRIITTATRPTTPLRTIEGLIAKRRLSQLRQIAPRCNTFRAQVTKPVIPHRSMNQSHHDPHNSQTSDDSLSVAIALLSVIVCSGAIGWMLYDASTDKCPWEVLRQPPSVRELEEEETPERDGKVRKVDSTLRNSDEIKRHFEGKIREVTEEAARNLDCRTSEVDMQIRELEEMTGQLEEKIRHLLENPKHFTDEDVYEYRQEHCRIEGSNSFFIEWLRVMPELYDVTPYFNIIRPQLEARMSAIKKRTSDIHSGALWQGAQHVVREK